MWNELAKGGARRQCILVAGRHLPPNSRLVISFIFFRLLPHFELMAQRPTHRPHGSTPNPVQKVLLVSCRPEADRLCLPDETCTTRVPMATNT